MTPYVDGYVLPVPTDRLDDYKKMAEIAAKVWVKHGALQYYECKGQDMKPDMAAESAFSCRLFPEMVGASDNETIIFAFVVYKSKEHRDEVNAKVMQDPEMAEGCDEDNMPFDPRKMAFGGFEAFVHNQS